MAQAVDQDEKVARFRREARRRLVERYRPQHVILFGSRVQGCHERQDGVILMPTISTFFGVVIQMFWTEHGPPHFHAVYAEHEAIIDIRELRVTRGSLPRRALALVLEWATEHREALLEDWDLCRQLKSPKPIPPLE